MNFIRILVKQPIGITTISARGFKHKHVLDLRCDGCYFKNIDQRWYVLCTKFPRHKQVERVERDKFRYIVSERCTNKYPAYKKRYQYPNQILG